MSDFDMKTDIESDELNPAISAACEDLIALCDEDSIAAGDYLLWLFSDEELCARRYGYLLALSDTFPESPRSGENDDAVLEKLRECGIEGAVGGAMDIKQLCWLASRCDSLPKAYEAVWKEPAAWAVTADPPIVAKGLTQPKTHKFRISPHTIAAADAGDENARAQFTNWSAPEASGIADVSMVLKPGSGGNRTVTVSCTAIARANKSLTAVLTIEANRIEIPLHADADDESCYVGEALISLEAGDFDLALEIDGFEMAPVA